LRITCDYDGNGFITKFKVVTSWLVLKAISRGLIYGRKSSDCGWHLKCHGLRVSFWTSLLIRFILLEDMRRSLFDLQRLKKPKQMLYTHKNGKASGKWSQSLTEVLG